MLPTYCIQPILQINTKNTNTTFQTQQTQTQQVNTITVEQIVYPILFISSIRLAVSAIALYTYIWIDENEDILSYQVPPFPSVLSLAITKYHKAS